MRRMRRPWTSRSSYGRDMDCSHSPIEADQPPFSTIAVVHGDDSLAAPPPLYVQYVHVNVRLRRCI